MKRNRHYPCHNFSTAIVLWWAILIVSTFPIVFRQVSISDAWWHVAIGKWLVREVNLPDLGNFYWPHADAEVLRSELRWQWLGDVVLYFVYAAIGDLGLQVLAVICLLASVFFLRRFASETLGPWTTLVMVAVTVGTYQLQLPRNSVFSLALYPLVLWMGSRNTKAPTGREYAQLSAVLLLWSCLHGSCLLGWATASLLLGSRVFGMLISAMRRHFAEARARMRNRLESREKFKLLSELRPLGCYLIIMGTLLLLISCGRADARDLLAQPIRHLGSFFNQPNVEAGLPVSLSKEAPNEQGAPSLKNWLNSLIWKRDKSLPWSNDYWSPLDLVTYARPVQAAYALAVLAAFFAVAFRNVPAGLILSWLASVLLGLSYVRMFGYLAMSSGAVLLFSTRTVGIAGRVWLQRLGWAVVACWALWAWGLFFSNSVNIFVPEAQHVSRIGKVPIYDDAVVDWIKSEFPDEKVFTTIETGSYCLLRWNFGKTVFLDGFFAAHPRELWRAYAEARTNRCLETIENRFRIKLAVLPVTSFGWIDIFKDSGKWCLVALGEGNLVFAHVSLKPALEHPRIFATEAGLNSTSGPYLDALLQSFCLSVTQRGANGTCFAFAEWAKVPEFRYLLQAARRNSDLAPLRFLESF